MKRIWSLLVALMMLIPAAGLAEINETGYPISDEVITLTCAGPKGVTIDWNETIQVIEFEKRLGIKLDCTQYDDSVWQTQLTLMLATDELPDIIINPGISLAEIGDYGSQGYFLDMAPYLEQYAPNIMAYAEEYPTFMPYNTSPDGGVYTLNQINPNLVGQISRVWLNKAWMDNLNLEYPETIEELTEVLRAFKAQDANGNGDPNDEIPLSNMNGYSVWHNLMTAFGIFQNNGATAYTMQLNDEGKIYLAETTENYKAFLIWVNQLWEEGLIDIDMFVQSEAEFRAKAAEDRVGMFGDAAPFVARGNDISEDKDFYWIGGLTSEWNETPTIVKSNAVSGSGEILISAATEHPEACVRFMDYLFTEEGNLAGTYGYEGSCFVYSTFPVEGMEEFTVVEMKAPEGEDWASAEEFRYKKAVINEGLNILKAWTGTQYPVLLAATDEQLEAALPAYGWAVRLVQKGINRCEIVDTFPTLLYNAEESDERTQLYTDLALYLDNMRAQFVTGQTDIETGWEDYLKQLNAMGYERLMEIEQAAYDRLMG